MIAKIDKYIKAKWSETCFKTDYQFEKILNETGKIIYSDTDDLSSKNLHDFFLERVTMYHLVSNKKNVENIAKCFIISMPKGENPSNERFVEISEKYLKMMGYGKCPRIVFRHFDTSLSHIHIVVSTISDEGKHISNDDDYKKSFEVSRQLEKEFGFNPLKGKSFLKESFQEKSFRSYYFQNALKKAISSKKENNRYLEDIPPDLLQQIKRSSLKNELLIELLGEDTYQKLGEKLKAGKYFDTSFKRELSERLEDLYRHGSEKDFLIHVKNSGIYVRKSPKGGLIYGLPEFSFYVNENSLNRKFHYQSLNENRTNFKLDSEQQQYIFEAFCTHCYGSEKIFMEKMNNYGIIIKDGDGEYLSVSKNFNFPFCKYQFLDTTSSDSVWIKGEDLSRKLSADTLNEILSEKKAHHYHVSENFKEVGPVKDDLFSRTLKKALRSEAVKERLTEIIPRDVIQYMKYYPLQKNQYKALVGSSMEAVENILYRGGFYHGHYLDQLKEKLNHAYSLTGGIRGDFFEKAHHEGIHIQMMRDDTLVYEISGEEGKFKFKENRVPLKFRNEYIKDQEVDGRFRLPEEQYRILRNLIPEAFKDTLFLKDVFNNLTRQNVGVYDGKGVPITYKNASQLSFGRCFFVDHSSKNPVMMQGTNISFKLSKMTFSEIIDKNMSDGIVKDYIKQQDIPQSFIYYPVNGRNNEEDFFTGKRKKKRSIGDIGYEEKM